MTNVNDDSTPATRGDLKQLRAEMAALEIRLMRNMESTVQSTVESSVQRAVGAGYEMMRREFGAALDALRAQTERHDALKAEHDAHVADNVRHRAPRRG